MINNFVIKYQRRLKRLSILGVFLLVAVVIFFRAYNAAPSQLEVDFLDVGQGDSILIKTPNQQKILIDGGPDNKVLDSLAPFLSWHDRTFDLLILTHPHADHLMGLIEILKRYTVKQIMFTNVNYDDQSYHYFIELAKQKKVPLTIITGPKLLNFGANCFLKILYPFKSLSGTHAKDLNNTSIIAQLIYGRNKFLFTGDAQVAAEKDLLAADVDLKSDILKVGHHGSKTASSLEFLQKVAPQLAVIEVGASNKFGHPATSTLERLQSLHIKIWRTDLNKSLQVFGNGQNLYYKSP